MSLIFMDSFDHYLDLTTNYDSVFQSAINTGGTARTGNGCLEILSGAFGPGKTIPVTLDCLMASSFWCSTGTNSGAVYAMGNEGGGVAYWQGVCVAVELNNDGSFTCIRGPSAGNAPLVSSAPGLFHFCNYNALALRVTVGINGSIKLWCNGQLVINATGLDTRNLHNPGNSQIDAVSLLGPGGNAFNAYHDDYYVLDCTQTPNDDYLGALRIYTGVPDADGAVQWTPSVGALNFSNVDSIPPNPLTGYNSSGTSGQADQYRYPLPSLPGNSAILAVQHCQDVQVDSGSQLVTSEVSGIVSPNPISPGNGWRFFDWPYDINSLTGIAWALSDFPLYAGPRIP